MDRRSDWDQAHSLSGDSALADASVTGFGTTVAFTRSYNSINRDPSQSGLFGPGWTHECERGILFPTPGNAALLMLRRSDGTVVYFEDDNGAVRAS